MIARSNEWLARVLSSYRRMIHWSARALLSILVVLSMTEARSASLDQVGPSTGLPLPRYVSLKSDRVNLREGPSQDHQTIWVFQRAGLPVEITAESDNWRRIRDSEGTEGWVSQSLLSGRRTVLVAPWKKETLILYAKPSETSEIVAKLQAGVLGNVRKCDGGSWCSIFGDGFSGYIQQSNLWGVYPNEKVE
jgi:SH3-like domain-containing protein